MGPVRFGGWDKSGEPIGVQENSPLVQIAAISDDQANNTMSLVLEMFAGGPVMQHYPDLDLNLNKITYPGGRKLQKVTASPRGREGQRTTFIVMDETHLWVPAEKGPELYEALARNVAKMNCRWVATTNAHAPGEESVAENHYNMHAKARSGDGFDTKMLFDTREVYVEDIYDREQAMPALKFVYGSAHWIDLENIFIEIQGTREHVARRFFFNQHVEGHTTWLNPKKWDGCKSKDMKLRKGDKISLGFKGNTPKGAAIVACRLDDGALFTLGWWENPNLKKGSWEVPAAEVDAKMRKTLEKYRVYKLCADPPPFQDIIGRWYSDYEEIVEEFWLSNKTNSARAVEQFESAVEGRRLIYLADGDISRHVLSCHTEDVPQGVNLRQETKYSTRYIFGAQAAVLAVEAAKIAIEEGALKEDIDNALYTF